MLYLGFAAFALLFLGDWNDWRLKKNWLRHCFFMGVALFVISTVGLCIGHKPVMPAIFRILFGILALIFGALTLYTVLSVAWKTNKNDEKKVYTGEFYALCRHPGILYFIPLYLCLWLTCGFPVYAAVAFSALDLLLGVFEDKVVFPAFLDGYDQYKSEVPFLIPTRSSFQRFLCNKCKDETL